MVIKARTASSDTITYENLDSVIEGEGTNNQ